VVVLLFLISSFACAVPGIMATRSISDPRDRFTTIMVAPLMTCSARLPVYALLIAAFIPNQMVWGFLICKVWCFWLIYVGYCQCIVCFDCDEISTKR
jgi:Fe2+ transport system protein B